jgi:hypothetical protein
MFPGLIARTKKLVVLTLIALAVAVPATPKNANAAIFCFVAVATIPAQNSYDVFIEAHLIGIGIASGVLAIAVAPYDPGFAVLFGILDSKGAIIENHSAEALARAFPALADQPDALNDLGAALNSEVARIAQRGPSNLRGSQTFSVSLPESRTRAILEQTNLSRSQIDSVVEALR